MSSRYSITKKGLFRKKKGLPPKICSPGEPCGASHWIKVEEVLYREEIKKRGFHKQPYSCYRVLSVGLLKDIHKA